MAAPVFRVRRPHITLARLEPAVPFFLGLHGLATTTLVPSSTAVTVGFAAVTALGLAGLSGWCTTRAVVLRAVACLALALAVQLAEPQLVPAMLQWYYCVAAVYSLMLTGWRAALVGPLTAAGYFAQVLLGSSPVPLTVAGLRSGVLAALGLVMYLAGRAYRHERDAAQHGRARAEAVGRQLAHMAAHDALTNLPNREQFLAQVHATLTGSEIPSATVLVLDVDRFKSVNDALGHTSGDRMLVELARRLAAWSRDRTSTPDTAVLTVARLGGDAFGVLVAAPDGAARATARCVLRIFDEPFTVDGRQLRITGSVGLAAAGGDGTTAAELLRAADVALYEAKAAGRNRLAVHETSMSQSTHRTLSLEQDLRAAVRAGSIQLHYQPISDLTSGDTVGVEALARWSRDGDGPVAPDVFIALAENLGLIGDLGAQVLVDALDTLSGWRRDGLALQYVAVNISPLQLSDPGFADLVASLLAARTLAPTSLVLEVTEGAVMQASPAVTATLEGLRAIGVSLSMDDFGTGYSSLTRLRHLPVSEIKIDRSFIAELSQDDTLTRIVLELATQFGLRTVAEGVETAEQLAALRHLGCDAAQGYHLGRPLPGADIPALLAARREIALSAADH
ncbi:MAG: putative bifunctional diguanylate cyclase/phosphodiesterase [Actinomycetes bacterium]